MTALLPLLLGGCLVGGQAWRDRLDRDGDGHVAEALGGDDCDDSDRSVHPGATPVPYDGIDQACTGRDADADGDGFRAGHLGGLDCDDGDPGVHPEAVDEPYDGVDANCDGASDFDADLDGADAALYGGDDCDDRDPETRPAAPDVPYDGVDSDCDGRSDFDADGDGEDARTYGGPDCDDTDPTVHSGATETWYDGVDSDCDGRSDFDADGDLADAASAGGGDCNDADPAVRPGRPDPPYDGVDSDCDGASDFDADLDGFDAAVFGGDDCDDARRHIHPGAPEVPYDGVDQACDGGDDYDADRDGFRAALYGGADCDDDTAHVHPGAVQSCWTRVDGDCDGTAGCTQVLAAEDGMAGEAPGDLAGSAVAALGDVDGDGWGDLAVGAPGAAGGRGAVYVVRGPAPLPASAGSGATVFVGAPGASLGAAVAACGDLDGDGLPDLLVGAPDLDHGAGRGVAYALSGAGVGPLDPAVAAFAELRGLVAGGRAVAAVGDVTGDGIPDVALGDPLAAAERGAVVVFAGPLSGVRTAAGAAATFIGEREGDELGSSLAGLGDFDGDGVGDVIAGAPYGDSVELFPTFFVDGEGASYLLYGPLSGHTVVDALSADAEIDCRLGLDARCGIAVAGPGDLDGDGYDDLVYGADSLLFSIAEADYGEITVLRGRFTRAPLSSQDAAGRLRSPVGGDALGRAIAPAGDVDGDGRADLVVGAPGLDPDRPGYALVLPGPLEGSFDLVPSGRFEGWVAGQEAGAAVAGGDLDGDGRGDVVIGAPASLGGRGGVWLMSTVALP